MPRTFLISLNVLVLCFSWRDSHSCILKHRRFHKHLFTGDMTRRWPPGLHRSITKDHFVSLFFPESGGDENGVCDVSPDFFYCKRLQAAVCRCTHTASGESQNPCPGLKRNLSAINHAVTKQEFRTQNIYTK